MLLFGATVLTGIVLLGGMIPYISESFAKIIFLSNSLTFMMVSRISIYICRSVLVFKSVSNNLSFFPGLRVEQTESLYSYELPGPVYFHCCLPPMGA